MLQKLQNDRDITDFEVGISLVRGAMVVPIPDELYDERVRQLQTAILSKLEENVLNAVILDFSAVRVLDAFAFETFTATAKMTALFGAPTIFSGLQAGVVAALVDLNFDCEAISTALSLEDAFERLGPLPASEPCSQEGLEEDSTQEESNEAPYEQEV